MVQGGCQIVSLELKEKLEYLNSQINFHTKIMYSLPEEQQFTYYYEKISNLIKNRNDCFKELRNKLKETHPEIFTGSEKNPDNIPRGKLSWKIKKWYLQNIKVRFKPWV